MFFCTFFTMHIWTAVSSNVPHIVPLRTNAYACFQTALKCVCSLPPLLPISNNVLMFIHAGLYWSLRALVFDFVKQGIFLFFLFHSPTRTIFICKSLPTYLLGFLHPLERDILFSYPLPPFCCPFSLSLSLSLSMCLPLPCLSWCKRVKWLLVKESALMTVLLTTELLQPKKHKWCYSPLQQQTCGLFLCSIMALLNIVPHQTALLEYMVE